MSTVQTSHKRFLSVPDSFKACVTSKNAKSDGGKELETALKYFTERIEEVELKVVDSTEIVDFLVTEDDENLSDNYYSGTKTKKIRTAVVRCNFTDSETLMRSVEVNCKRHKVERVIVSSHSTSLQGVFDQIKENTEKRYRTIVVIEQLESMDTEVFNRLITLLSFYDHDVALLICVSTCRSALVSHCSMDNMELLFLKFYPLSPPQDQFDELAKVLTRLEDPKAPNLFLSGELLHFLQNRFLRGDFSLAELKKIVKLSIVNNFLKYDSYLEKEDDDFLERLPIYWEWFDALFGVIENAFIDLSDPAHIPSQIDLHSEVQRDAAGFWKENKAVELVRTWLSEKPREELCEFLEILARTVREASPHESEKLRDLAASLQADAAAVAAAVPSSQAPPTPVGGKKMTMTELLRANRMAKAANAGSVNKLREAVGTVMGMLREHIFPWGQYEDYLLMVPDGIQVPDLSHSLITRADKSLSQAYSALAGIDQFKAVPMAEWGAMVADRMDPGEFYDCVAQLERMGAIKDMSRQGKPAVMLQMRPMVNLN